jgi:ribosomal protein L44E
MKIPKTQKKFCAKCKKYADHKVTRAKRKTPGAKHPMSLGSKKRAKMRGVRGSGNLGKYSKPPINKFKMAGQKQSKKIDLRITCGACKTGKIRAMGRARKVEFI